MTTADKLIGLLRIHCDLPCGLDLTEDQQQFFADAAAQLVAGGPDSFSERQADWIAAIHGRAIKQFTQGAKAAKPAFHAKAPGVKAPQPQQQADQRSDQMRPARSDAGR